MNPDLIGALVAHVIFLLCLTVFWARLRGSEKLEYGVGLVLVAMIVPLGYLVWSAVGLGRAPLYFIQLSLMIGYLVVELFLDYILKVDFRHVRWAAIVYVTLFFAATGGMIGVAAEAGRGPSVSAVVLFLAMAGLAFYQRSVTGR